jgi:hypothetical protein
MTKTSDANRANEIVPQEHEYLQPEPYPVARRRIDEVRRALLKELWLTHEEMEGG